ncbi:MAG: hypothetical protein HY788_00935 [Deltaproteobacteria bacterium]|nr:hypothetical protein [Deltaproteobacteria bacterium]
MIQADDIRSLFSNVELLDRERHYLDTQAIRLSYVVNLVQEFCNQHTVHKILDVGPHFLTRCVKEFIMPEVSVSTLGYEYPKLMPLDLVDEHVRYNLVDSIDNKPVVFNKAPFDLILFCETIEHIYISPNHVLSLLVALLKKPEGGLLIQTPNAVSLNKRLMMLRGLNPFELLREDFEFKGHIREYTMGELVNYGLNVGLSVWRKAFCSYWPHLCTNAIERSMQTLLPPLRPGLTVFFRS